MEIEYFCVYWSHQKKFQSLSRINSLNWTIISQFSKRKKITRFEWFNVIISLFFLYHSSLSVCFCYFDFISYLYSSIISPLNIFPCLQLYLSSAYTSLFSLLPFSNLCISFDHPLSIFLYSFCISLYVLLYLFLLFKTTGVHAWTK